MPQALCGWTPLPFSTGLGFFDSWTRFKKAFLMGSGGRGWGWSHYFCHFPSCEPRCRPAAPRGPELTALSFFSSLSSGRLPAPAPSRFFCVCKVKVLLGYKLHWFRDSKWTAQNKQKEHTAGDGKQRAWGGSGWDLPRQQRWAGTSAPMPPVGIAHIHPWKPLFSCHQNLRWPLLVKSFWGV